MPEPGKSDQWNSLLETLGVPATEPAPEAARSRASRPQPLHAAPERRSPRRSPRPRRPRRSRPAIGRGSPGRWDWNRLLSRNRRRPRPCPSRRPGVGSWGVRVGRQARGQKTRSAAAAETREHVRSEGPGRGCVFVGSRWCGRAAATRFIANRRRLAANRQQAGANRLPAGGSRPPSRREPPPAA